MVVPGHADAGVEGLDGPLDLVMGHGRAEHSGHVGRVGLVGENLGDLGLQEERPGLVLDEIRGGHAVEPLADPALDQTRCPGQV